MRWPRKRRKRRTTGRPSFSSRRCPAPTRAWPPTMGRHLGEGNGADQPLMLCIDQFEELFTLAPPGHRDKLVTALSAMTDPADSKIRVVIAIRADFYAACAQLPWLAERITANQ